MCRRFRGNKSREGDQVVKCISSTGRKKMFVFYVFKYRFLRIVVKYGKDKEEGSLMRKSVMITGRA